jgi:hypothetical protein
MEKPSKRIDVLTKKKRELTRLNREVKRLARDLDELVDKHNTFRVGGGAQKVIEWFESFPIETLRESLDYDHSKPRKKLTLADLSEKGRVRRAHALKEEQLELAEHRRTAAEIDVLLEKINRLLKV